MFCGHPSLRFGDVIHFIELWGSSPNNAVVFTGNPIRVASGNEAKNLSPCCTIEFVEVIARASLGLLLLVLLSSPILLGSSLLARGNYKVELTGFYMANGSLGNGKLPDHTATAPTRSEVYPL